MIRKDRVIEAFDGFNRRVDVFDAEENPPHDVHVALHRPNETEISCGGREST